MMTTRNIDMANRLETTRRVDHVTARINSGHKA